MNYFKRISTIVLAGMMFLSSTAAVKAESNDEKLNNMQQQLQQNDENIQQQEEEKQAVMKEIQGIEKELHNLNNTIAKNKEEQSVIQGKIDETNKQIEQKKQEIIDLQDKVLMRKDIMKKRMISVQNHSNVNFVVDVLVDSTSIGDLLQRMNAVSTIMEADKEILSLQEQDLMQIETDKKVIDEKEKALEVEKQKLATAEAALQQDLNKRQEHLDTVQTKYNAIAAQLTMAEQEKAKIEANMKSVQETIAREKAEAEARAKAEAEAKAAREANNKERTEAVNSNTPVEGKPAGGREFYVTATAYSNDPLENGKKPGEQVYTRYGGYNLTANPHLKIIAVDPSVIPPLSRVWVEGYGVAIAADTGGAIKGHKIDVFIADKTAVYNWGRRTVKVAIL
ncbi:cell wall-binding protein [Bacillus manliponensis]|uniref:Cell wall-binding protein n=1 Tax=Bacillus manliponensis TaxID=574376 RepID=A0A073K7A3_9BACI|nr:3D domain-containing protein [Bacillus manliponensis]KEK18143.1 cell wall-binding protein [Bacillus manliponensis]